MLILIPVISFGTTYKFDFDASRAGETIRTAAGYTSITTNSLYTTTAGYGFIGGIPSGDGRDYGAINDPYTDLYGDVVYPGNWNIWFRMDVTPGDYMINLSVGIPGWYSWCIVDIQDTTYQWNQNPAGADSIPSPDNGTMKIIDVYNITNGHARIRKLVAENSTNAAATTTAGEVHYGSYPYVKAYGFNNTDDYTGKNYYYNDTHRSEYLLIDNAVITQEQLYYDSTNELYYIKVRPWKPGSQAPGLTMLELHAIPAAPTIALLCLGLWILFIKSHLSSKKEHS